MTCEKCGQGIHWVPEGTEDGGSWYHDRLIDTWECNANI
jgi:hypothetical protein